MPAHKNELYQHDRLLYESGQTHGSAGSVTSDTINIIEKSIITNDLGMISLCQK